MDLVNFGKGVEIENSSSGIDPSLILSNSPITWSFYPDIDIMLFDPDFPINGSIGWEAKLAYRIRAIQLQ